MIRVQQKRGVKLPPGVKSVARPSRWGNPYKVGHVLVGEIMKPYDRSVTVDVVEVVDTELAVALYAAWSRSTFDEPTMTEWLAPLRNASGLACYCPLDAPCHADVLIDHLESGGWTA